jgi:hypothetical protein
VVFVKLRWLALCLFIACSLSGCMGRPARPDSPAPAASAAAPEWQADFGLEARKLSSTGQTTYFSLVPGDRSVLISEASKLAITVLDQTRQIGGILTRVVEEREEVNGSVVEVSRNFFAIDAETGDVFYFGEEVDLYSNGQMTGHGGAWLAFENGNRPGLVMPGHPAVGMKYYQEMAPGVAEDRAQVVSISESITTHAGHFENCLVTQESSAREPGVVEYKTYCPALGLVQDEAMTLSGYSSTGIPNP